MQTTTETSFKERLDKVKVTFEFSSVHELAALICAVNLNTSYTKSEEAVAAAPNHGGCYTDPQTVRAVCSAAYAELVDVMINLEMKGIAIKRATA